MIKFTLLATLEAISGKENEVETFLKSTLQLAETETNTWNAFKMGPNKFGIFDSFTKEKECNTQLAVEIAKALIAQAPDLFVLDPQTQQVEVVPFKESPVKESSI